mmetsp:Transcript_56014/g.131916  ORF Transcript_56014/g.131916 Transcript_56014/m.131916 type:complete len:228 (+) Transcript_56014:2139-2822(+)
MLLTVLASGVAVSAASGVRVLLIRRRRIKGPDPDALPDPNPNEPNMSSRPMLMATTKGNSRGSASSPPTMRVEALLCRSCMPSTPALWSCARLRRGCSALVWRAGRTLAAVWAAERCACAWTWSLVCARLMLRRLRSGVLTRSTCLCLLARGLCCFACSFFALFFSTGAACRSKTARRAPISSAFDLCSPFLCLAAPRNAAAGGAALRCSKLLALQSGIMSGSISRA